MVGFWEYFEGHADWTADGLGVCKVCVREVKILSSDVGRMVSPLTETNKAEKRMFGKRNERELPQLGEKRLQFTSYLLVGGCTRCSGSGTRQDVHSCHFCLAL